jgi:hypothetical protein
MENTNKYDGIFRKGGGEEVAEREVETRAAEIINKQKLRSSSIDAWCLGNTNSKLMHA